MRTGFSLLPLNAARWPGIPVYDGLGTMSPDTILRALLPATLAVGLAVAAPAPSPGKEVSSMTLSSPAFDHQGSIPARLTCDGANVSPALRWNGVPETAKSLALIVTDPDAPDPKAPKMTWVHWVLYGIPPDATELREAISGKGLPEGTLEGTNDWGKTGYGGPCPPIGRHRYVFTLYALDTVLSDLGGPRRDRLEAAMAGHVLAKAELIGTYRRQ
jgi:Raf kinase inhibitor-like YbhB/YbcL family protein